VRSGGGGDVRLFPGESELADLMRCLDWSRTELGPPARWPENLKTAIGICLASRFPMALLWGASSTLLYNDAYISFLGPTRHPHHLGRPVREAWTENWPAVGAMIDKVRATGESVGSDDVQQFYTRNLPKEEAFVRFMLGPVFGADGVTVDGILMPCTDTTEQVVTTRRLETLHRLGETVEARPVDAACAAAAHVLQQDAHDIPFAAIYVIEPGERAITLRGTAGLSTGHPFPAAVSIADRDSCGWPLVSVLRSGVSSMVSPIAEVMPGGPWAEPSTKALVLPILGTDQQTVAGVLVAGVSSRRAWDAVYQRFFTSIAKNIGTALAVATAYEAEKRRAESLAEIDRVKTAFFSNISQEFRTPLTLMLGPIEDALVLPDRMLRGNELESVYRNARRLLKLVNSLLDFSQLEAGRIKATYRPIDLATLTTDLVSGFRPAIERAGMQLIVDCPLLSRQVYVDHEMWEKIVLNLVSNSFKFTFDGSIRVALRETDGRVVLTIADTGTGIPVEDLPHLFERFHRIEGAKARTHEGSGIGLALVHELVRLHDGHIEVASTLGVGTTVTVRIPYGHAEFSAGERVNVRVRAAVTPAMADTFVAESLQWASGEASREPAVMQIDPAVRILVVDDNADMRSYLTRLLGKRWLVEAVPDGEVALAAIRARRPTLVITDVMMPNLDGLGLLRALRGDPSTRSIPVILVSARAGDDAQIEGLEAGADDYLVKPFSARELIARVVTRLELSQLGTRLVEERAAIIEMFWQAPVPVAIFRGQDLVYEGANEAYNLAVEAKLDLHGKPMRGVYPRLELQFGDMLREVMRTGVAYVGREVLVPLDRQDRLEETYWTFIAASLRGPCAEDDCVVAICTEVTEQVVTNKRLEILAREAEAANRTKDEFLAMLGHELRNPLSPIVTSLQLLRMRDANSAEQDIIERQVNHLRRMVDDLLDVSRIARGKVELRHERVEIVDVIARAVETATPLLTQRRHRLELRVPRSGLAIDADPDRMAQVFSNLLTNSAKYSEIGTRITVEAEQLGERVHVRVIDEGVGIAPHMIDKVFDMFVQQPQNLDRSRGGLGLGLSIAKSMVEVHGGMISVHSAGVGKGSEFEVVLPIAGPPMLVDAPPSVLCGDTGVIRRILVVDDNHDAAQMMKRALERLGCAVAVAHDGPGALHTATAFEPDIALLDIGLPIMDGYELAQRLREQRRVHLVAVTGYGQESDRGRAARAGFEEHLVKPIDLASLARVVKELR
jgi:signal transduction histidine kinase/response regulator RpfG family c-di-GMP phosphodiesterase